MNRSWVAAALVAAFGPVIVGAFHWIATFSEIPVSKAPQGTTLAHLRTADLVLEPNVFSYLFVAACAVATVVALTAIRFVRWDRLQIQTLVGAELLAVPVLLLVSSGERWAASALIMKEYGSAVWVLSLDGIPVLISVVCAGVGAVLIIRAVGARRR